MIKNLFEKLNKIFDPLHDERISYDIAINNLENRDEWIYYVWANDIENYVKALRKSCSWNVFLRDWFLLIGIIYVLVYYGVLPV